MYCCVPLSDKCTPDHGLVFQFFVSSLIMIDCIPNTLNQVGCLSMLFVGAIVMFIWRALFPFALLLHL